MARDEGRIVKLTLTCITKVDTDRELELARILLDTSALTFADLHKLIPLPAALTASLEKV